MRYTLLSALLIPLCASSALGQQQPAADSTKHAKPASQHAASHHAAAHRAASHDSASQHSTSKDSASQHSESEHSESQHSGRAKAAPGEDFTWGPAPAIFPAGAKMAVLQGDPTGSEMFTVRLRMPNGYRIAPHTHPTDEHVTVISGHFKVGMGDTANTKAMMTLHPGAFITAPANKSHYASAVGPTVVQVSGMGPFAMTYVNPADTPAAAKQ